MTNETLKLLASPWNRIMIDPMAEKKSHASKPEKDDLEELRRLAEEASIILQKIPDEHIIEAIRKSRDER